MDMNTSYLAVFCHAIIIGANVFAVEAGYITTDLQVATAKIMAAVSLAAITIIVSCANS